MVKHKNVTTIPDNTQRHAFQLTINNPLDHGLTHQAIKELLITKFSTLKYFCMADEISTTGTPHTHIYVYFTSRVRFRTIKKQLEVAHIEFAKDTIESNIDYIRKTGKWEETAKARTRVEGSFEEWGTVPKQKGTIPAMEELYEMIKSGMTNSEILAYNNDYLLNIEKLDRVRTTLLIDEYKNKRRTDLKVIYVFGATGTGKTRDILDRHSDANVYRVTDYQHPFDGYECQPVMVFEEYRSGFRISDILNYADIYPIQLPARYANRFACYNILYLVSNWKLEEQYFEIQKDNPESWKAFLRRIHEVHVYNSDGTIDIYCSTHDYINRDTKFRSIDNIEQISIPFEE